MTANQLSDFADIRDFCKYGPIIARDEHSRAEPLGKQDKARLYGRKGAMTSNYVEIAGWSDDAGCWLRFTLYHDHYIYYGRASSIGDLEAIAE